MPAFTIPLHEANDCHLPAGRPDGGQFCSKDGIDRSAQSYVDPFGNRQYPLDRDFANRPSPTTVFRGITTEEAEFIRRTGTIKSRGDFSHSSEGTSFSDDLATAEGAVNFGRTNPLKTKRPNYVIEVLRGPGIKVDPRDGWPKAAEAIPASRIRRVWVFHPDGRVELKDRL